MKLYKKIHKLYQSVLFLNIISDRVLPYWFTEESLAAFDCEIGGWKLYALKSSAYMIMDWLSYIGE